VIKEDKEYPDWVFKLSEKVSAWVRCPSFWSCCICLRCCIVSLISYASNIFSPTHLQLPSKVALMDKFGPNGEGVDSMTTEEKKRLKRLLRLAIIKEKNAASQSEA